MQRITIANLGGVRTLTRESTTAIRGGIRPRPPLRDELYERCLENMKRLHFPESLARQMCRRRFPGPISHRFGSSLGGSVPRAVLI
jgi:hypothetical protein